MNIEAAPPAALHHHAPHFSRHARLADWSLTALVVWLAIDLFGVRPLVEAGIFNRHIADAAAIGTLAIAVAGVSGRHRLARVFIAVAIACVAVRLANFELPDRQLRAADATLSLAAYTLLGWMVLLHTFRRGPVSHHRVLGAIAAYLLMAFAFAQAYRLVAMHVPGAFLVLGQPFDYDQVVARLHYFSAVTLTTLGYGDITPAHPFARSLATLEAFAGVLYPAILIGRIVALDLDRRHPI